LRILPINSSGGDEGNDRFCPTGNSHIAAMRKLPVVLICRKPLVLPKTPNQPHIHSVPFSQEGRFAIVTNVEAGCGGRFGDARRATLEADGEVVWS
jgi:hypothetical protein